MIPRYSRPQMTAIWAAQNKFRIWYDIEALACEALAKVGTIPQTASENIWAAKDHFHSGQIDVAAIDAIEAKTKHDVIAFLTYMADQVGPDSGLSIRG